MTPESARLAAALVRQNLRLRQALAAEATGDATLLAAAMEAHDYWRRRCPVTEADLAAERITLDVLTEWLKSNPLQGHEADPPAWADRDQREAGGAQARGLIVATIDAAVSRRRMGGAEICPHDVLDQLAEIRERMEAAQ